MLLAEDTAFDAADAGPVTNGVTDPKTPPDVGDPHITVERDGTGVNIGLETTTGDNGELFGNFHFDFPTQDLGAFTIGYHDSSITGSVFHDFGDGSTGTSLSYDFGNGIDFSLSVSAAEGGGVDVGIHFSFGF